MVEFKIADRTVGPGHPAYIIAEAGSNHNGSLENALQLVSIAAEAGADAVKFQLFRADKLYPATAGEADYLKAGKSIHQIIREMEMPLGWLARLQNTCGEKGIHFLCSAFDEESLAQLNPFVPAHKIASYELTHEPLVRAVAATGKPVILSTGAANLEEVDQAVTALRESGCREFALLQCTAKYPAPLESIHLRSLQHLQDRYECVTGLSDHSLDEVIAPLGAVACGASIVEKHFTLDKSLPGPDHAFAIEPHQLRRMVDAIRGLEKALGSASKQIDTVEQELRHFARRSVFALRDLQPGEKITAENTAVLRRGKHEEGVAPADHVKILGRVVRSSIRANTPVQWTQIEQ